MKLPVPNAREARPAPARWNVAKTLFWTLLFWLTFLAALPAAVYAAESALGLTAWRFAGPAGRAAGAALFLFGAALGPASSMVMAVRGGGTPLPTDCAPRLVVSGPYRYVRNPMAVAGLAQGAGVGLWLGSPAVVLYALSGGPIWDVFVRPWEEADLERRFGEPYRRYRAAVDCWVPRRRGYRADG